MNGILNDLLDGVHERLAAFHAATGAPLPAIAPDCSVFELSGLDELFVSRVLAWLLSPDGSHAQGGRFLDSFCRHFEIAPPPYRRLRVEIELATSLISRTQRRIDICVLDDDWSLGIENKPVAVFQHRQLADYLDQLRRRSPANAVLVVLKGWEGDLPSDQLAHPGMRQALLARDLINADYSDIQAWLGECASLAEAPYVGFLINDLKRSLQRWLTEGTDMRRQLEVASAIVGHAVRRDAALELIASTDCLLGLVSDRFVADLTARLTPSGLRVLAPERVDLPQKEYLDVEIDQSLPYVFAFTFDNANLRKPYFGLRLRSGGYATASPYGRIRHALGELGLTSRESYTDYWFWWNYIDERDFGFPYTDGLAVWKALGSGSFAAKMAEIAVRFRERLGEIGALDWTKFAAPRRGRKV